MEKVAGNWTAKEPKNVEAWYYAGMAAQNLGDSTTANKDFQTALSLHPNHPATLQALALIAHQNGNEAAVEKIRLTLKDVNAELLENLDEALKPQTK